MTLEEQLEQSLRSCPQILQCLEKGIDVHAVLNRVIAQQVEGGEGPERGGSFTYLSNAYLKAQQAGRVAHRGWRHGSKGPAGGQPPRPERAFSRAPDEKQQAAPAGLKTAVSGGKFLHADGVLSMGPDGTGGGFRDMFGIEDDDCGALPFDPDASFFSEFGSSDLEDDSGGGTVGWGSGVESGSRNVSIGWEGRHWTKELGQIDVARSLPHMMGHRPSSCTSLPGFVIDAATNTAGEGPTSSVVTVATGAGREAHLVLPLLDLSYPPIPDVGLTPSDRMATVTAPSIGVAANVTLGSLPGDGDKALGREAQDLLSDEGDKVRRCKSCTQSMRG